MVRVGTLPRSVARSRYLGHRIDRRSIVIVDRQAVRTPRPPAGVVSQWFGTTGAARPADRFEAAQAFTGRRKSVMTPGVYSQYRHTLECDRHRRTSIGPRPFIRSRRTLRVPRPPREFEQWPGRSTEPSRGMLLLWSRDVPNSCGPHAAARGDLMETDPPLGQERATPADGQT
jgi:hypothetical protein